MAKSQFALVYSVTRPGCPFAMMSEVRGGQITVYCPVGVKGLRGDYVGL